MSINGQLHERQLDYFDTSYRIIHQLDHHFMCFVLKLSGVKLIFSSFLEVIY